MRHVLPSLALSALSTACATEILEPVEKEATGPVSSSSDASDAPSPGNTNTSAHSESGGTDASTDDDSTSSDGPEGKGTSTSGSMETDSADLTSSPQSETSEGSEDSTGPSEPICGNGVIEGDETCDDGNETPADGCQECAKDSIVFVSSELYQGFSLQGLYGADQRCRSLAGKAGLPRHLTYKAWLSTPTMSVSDRLLHSKGRYVLVNGLVVAQNWDALTAEVLENPIMVDESSLSRDDAVWTGTLANGEPSLGDEFCEDWDDDSGLLKFAGVGISSSIDTTWSFFEPAPCDSELRLYCIEQ